MTDGEQFGRRLTAFRNARHYSNVALAEYLSRETGLDIKTRTTENWLQGARPPHLIWRKAIEDAIK